MTGGSDSGPGTADMTAGGSGMAGGGSIARAISASVQRCRGSVAVACSTMVASGSLSTSGARRLRTVVTSREDGLEQSAQALSPELGLSVPGHTPVGREPFLPVHSRDETLEVGGGPDLALPLLTLSLDHERWHRSS